MKESEEAQIRSLQDDLTRRQFKRRVPKKMGDVVNTLLAKRGYAQVQTQEALQREWESVVGSQLARSSRAGRLSRGVLEVVVRNSAVLQELTFQRNQLLDKLATRLEGVSLKRLRFRVGAVD